MKVSLSPYWPQMSHQEKLDHFKMIGERLLEHRYRYYVQDHPVLSDYEYDYVEKYYELLASELKLPPAASDMVGFDPMKPGAKSAKNRVESNQDSYSLWLKVMKPIWDKLGFSKKQDNIKNKL